MNCEMQGVKYVELAIAKTDYLVPHINNNDREPSWDGDIEVYHKAGDVHAKEDLILKIPVQIKGHKAGKIQKKEITYPVEYVDMKNYLNAGGTVFFVVYVDEEGENHRIYYAEFLPFELKKIIRNNKEKNAKTKNILMKILPTTKDDISNVFLGFARNMQKQRSAILSDEVSLEDIVKSGTIPQLSFGFSCVPKKGVTPFDLMLKGNFYLYAKMPHGIEIPVEHIESIDMANTTISAQISVNEKVFYDKYKVVYKKDVIELHFGESVKHIIDRKDDTKQRFEFSLAGTLTERIRDEEFFIEAIKAQQFKVGKIVCPFDEITPEELTNFDLPARQEHLEELFEVKNVLDVLDVNADLECSNLKVEDEMNLQILKLAVINGETVPLKITGENIENIFGFFSIANLQILVCVIKREDGKFNVYNYNDAPIESNTEGDDGKIYPSSSHVLLNKEVILKSCNLNYKKIFMQIKQVPGSECYFGQLTTLLLEVLSAYDASETKRKDLLEFASKLAEWIRHNDVYTSKELLILNYYQVIKRQRKFTEEETKELMQIIESDSETEEVYTGAYLLLDNQDAAKIHFDRMDKETQTVFCKYPIAYFWNKKQIDTISKEGT